MKKEIFKTTESLQKAIGEFFSDGLDASRVTNERSVIWRNLLYYCGFQDIEYMRSSGSFRRRKGSEYAPKPVSNEIREFVRSIKALLMNQKMIPRVWPNTDEKEDQMAAELGQKVSVSMDHGHDGQFFDEQEKLIIWLCLSGTAFMRTFPDMDGGKWVMGDDGLWKTGDVATECLLPFNVRLDTYGDRLDLKRWVGIQSLKSREWVEDTFKVKLEGPDNETRAVDYQTQIARMVSDVSPLGGGPSGLVAAPDEDSVLFREVEFKPTAQYPFGRYVISAGGVIVKIYERLPIMSTAEEWYYSLTDFHYNYVPGRFWADPPLNDLISPQNTINEIDHSLAVNRKGIGRPRILVAGEIGLKKMDSSGQGFLAMSYNPIMGTEPKIHEGTPLPVQVLEERRLQKEQFQDSGGDPKNVLKGKAPSANASGILTQQLRETALQGKEPDVARYNRSLTRVYKKRLLLAQEIFTEEHLLKSMGRGNKVQIRKFKGADLRGNTDVRLELDSGLISTKSGQAEMIVNLVQAGFFKDQDTDPTLRQEVLQRLGMTGFSDETDNDIDRAELENVSVASGENVVMQAKPDEETGEDEVVVFDPLFRFDNHAKHFDAHRKFIISQEFAGLPGQAKQILVDHANLHQKVIDDTPPDIREFIQIDKILLPGVLTASERAQVLSKYLGIEPGDELEAGLPTADVVLKSKEKLLQTDKKSELKREEMDLNMQKHIISETVKMDAIDANKNKPQAKGK